MIFALVFGCLFAQTEMFSLNPEGKVSKRDADGSFVRQVDSVVPPVNQKWDRKIAQLDSGEGPFCGRNCLYWMLRSHGMLVTQQEIDDVLPVTEKGVTLASLAQTAEHFGLDVEMKLVPPRKLMDAPLPFIARLGDNVDSGHFLFVYDRLGTSFKAIDGANHSKLLLKSDSLAEDFSGHVIFPAKHGKWQIGFRVVLVIAAVEMLLIGSIWRRIKS